VPEVLAELGERRLLSASSLESWLECPYRWFVAHELRPERLEPTPDPLWLGGVVHTALRGLYADPPGRDSIPREADVEDWKRRFGELLDAAVAERGGDAGRVERAIALARVRTQVEAFLDTEAASETALRPGERLLERSFGFEEEGDPGPLELGEGVALRGTIDRIDLAPDGGGAVVRDYKTGSSVAPAARFAAEGVLQVQLYMLAARERLGLEPIAGLYQPLGRPATAARAGSRSPATSASTMARPDWVMVLDATESILMPASSSTLSMRWISWVRSSTSRAR
jgi:ATP-dependent helicase/DNAse subunit B